MSTSSRSAAAERVVVVGGGVAGLAAASRLRQTTPAARVTLVERDTRLGGKILTDRIDGFVIEGGPDSFLSSKPRGVELCREVGIGDSLVGTIPENRRTYVMRDGVLHPMPEGLSGLIPARIEPVFGSRLFSDEGKARFAAERQVVGKVDDEDESLASFMTRRFGPEVYERLIEPLMSGIYAGDGRLLSVAATFPQLRSMEKEHGSLLTAMEARQAGGSMAIRPGFLTPRSGMAAIIEAIEPRLEGVEICCGASVGTIREERGGYRVELEDGRSLEASKVIVATPAYAAARILGTLDPALAAELAGIYHVSTATAALGFRAKNVPHPLDGYGYIVPRGEGRPVLAVTWVSRKFPDRAPPGYVLIRVFLGRRGQEDVLEGDDQSLVALAREELRSTLGIHAAPLITRVVRWPKGMPQYDLGHLDRLRAIEQRLEAHPGLRLAGNAFRGVGIPDCIASGETAADAVSS